MDEFFKELEERRYYEKETSKYLFKDGISVEILGNMVLIRRVKRIQNLDMELVNVYTIVFKGIIRTPNEFKTVLNIMERSESN